MIDGYIKLHRKILVKHKGSILGFFTYILLRANFKDTTWTDPVSERIIPVSAGSFITSRAKMSRESGFSERKIRTMLSKLEATSETTSRTTNHYTLIKVVNWAKYQSDETKATSETTSTSTSLLKKKGYNKKEVISNFKEKYNDLDLEKEWDKFEDFNKYKRKQPIKNMAWAFRNWLDNAQKWNLQKKNTDRIIWNDKLNLWKVGDKKFMSKGEAEDYIDKQG